MTTLTFFFFCNAPATENGNTGCIPKTQVDETEALVESVEKNEERKKRLGRAWEWITNSFGANKGNKKRKTMETSKNTHYKDKFVFARRGHCSFEEKALEAQHHEAAGLIVMNTDDNMFVMARAVQENDESDADDIKIPAVMMTHSDAGEILDLNRHIQNEAHFLEHPKISLEMKLLPNFLNSEYMGNFGYPKIHVSPDFISIMSRGKWYQYIYCGPYL